MQQGQNVTVNLPERTNYAVHRQQEDVQKSSEQNWFIPPRQIAQGSRMQRLEQSPDRILETSDEVSLSMAAIQRQDNQLSNDSAERLLRSLESSSRTNNNIDTSKIWSVQRNQSQRTNEQASRRARLRSR